MAVSARVTSISFKMTSALEEAYVLTIHFTRAESMISTDMKVTSADDSKDTEDIGDAAIYELQTKHHIARRTDYEKE